MARWETTFALERRSGVPLLQQITRAVTSDIQRGRLRPGDPLPGTRTLALALGVQRQTVVAAFDELVAEGWIVTQPARGAFVSTDLPEPESRRVTSRGTSTSIIEHPGFDLPPAPRPELPIDVPHGSLLFASIRPDVRLVPAAVLGRSIRRAMKRRSGALLSDGPPEGHPRLRQAVAQMLTFARGLAVASSNICITRGSQMALSLIARSILRPGDVIAVEELGYYSAWEAFRQTGAKLIAVPVDCNGLRVDVLERISRRKSLRAVYVTSHHQFPTGVTLSPGRRVKLLDLAQAHRFAIIEDDYDHELHYDGPPVLPLASADRFGVVVYVGTFSKVLAPAIRLGYIAAPTQVIGRVAAHRSHFDTQGDQVLEYAVGELLDEGEIQRHIRRVRREYRARRDTLVHALQKRLGDRVTFDVPAGGMALWVKVEAGLDVDRWAAAADQKGAIVTTASTYTFDRRPQPYMRLGFASLNGRELEEGVRRLAAACPGPVEGI